MQIKYFFIIKFKKIILKIKIMNSSDKNGLQDINDSMLNDGFEIDFDSKNSSINHDLKSAYDQLYKEIKYSTGNKIIRIEILIF